MKTCVCVGVCMGECLEMVLAVERKGREEMKRSTALYLSFGTLPRSSEDTSDLGGRYLHR